MTLKEAMNSIKPASQALRQQAKQRWDQVAKPLGSLGVLAEDIIRIAAASGSLAVSLRPRAIVVMCGDNGVVNHDDENGRVNSAHDRVEHLGELKARNLKHVNLVVCGEHAEVQRKRAQAQQNAAEQATPQGLLAVFGLRANLGNEWNASDDVVGNIVQGSHDNDDP